VEVAHVANSQACQRGTPYRPPIFDLTAELCARFRLQARPISPPDVELHSRQSLEGLQTPMSATVSQLRVESKHRHSAYFEMDMDIFRGIAKSIAHPAFEEYKGAVNLSPTFASRSGVTVYTQLRVFPAGNG
jgi:hypothetical protein